MKFKYSILVALVFLIIGNIINYIFFAGDKITSVLNISAICLIILSIFVIKKSS